MLFSTVDSNNRRGNFFRVPLLYYTIALGDVIIMNFIVGSKVQCELFGDKSDILWNKETSIM